MCHGSNEAGNPDFGTVAHRFCAQAVAGYSLTVYGGDSNWRPFIHVADVARAYVRSAERLQVQLAAGETGVDHYMIASDEDVDVRTIAEAVQRIAGEVADLSPSVELVENPRSGEATVEQFSVDTAKTNEELGWASTHTVEETIRRQIIANTDG